MSAACILRSYSLRPVSFYTAATPLDYLYPANLSTIAGVARAVTIVMARCRQTSSISEVNFVQLRPDSVVAPPSVTNVMYNLIKNEIKTIERCVVNVFCRLFAAIEKKI